MRLLKQSDPRWASEKIGNSQSTLARYGCLLTCLSMLSDWYGTFHTPGWMARNLSFTSDGRLLWQSIRPQMRFVYRYYKRDDAKIKSILFSKDNAVILEVPAFNAKHWVLVVGFSRWYGFKIADPLDGTTKWLDKSYRHITGFAEITRAI